MDVAREFKEVNFKIKMQARRSALLAEARMYGMTFDEYRGKLAVEEAQRRIEENSAIIASGIYGLGRAWGEATKQISAMVKAFNEGVREGLQ